jgi:hypothetical protein
LLRPDAGTIRVAGVDALADPAAAKRIMAWISDEPMIYDKLTPLEYLEFMPACGASIRRPAKGARKSCSTGSISRRMRSSAAKASPKACGRSRRRAGARPASDHSRRTADRTRCRLGASGHVWTAPAVQEGI